MDRPLRLGPLAYFEVAGEMVFGEESLVALLADKVSAALVRVHVLLQVVGFEEVLVALRALYLPFAVARKVKRERGFTLLFNRIAANQDDKFKKPQS